jgi:hypothetical protein
MTKYPAAERIASELPVGDGDDVESLLEVWRDAYRRRHRSNPSEAEADAALAVIDAKIRNDVPPPLPPSASSSGWSLCTFETGLPGTDADTE